MTEIRIPVPQIPTGMGSNILGLAGLIGVALAIGGLTGNWWWSVLTGSAFAVALAVIAQLGAQDAVEEQQADPATPAPPRLAAAARTA